MTKGHLLGVEAFLIFFAWLLILASIWSHASFSAHAQLDSWKTARAFEQALSVSDALLRNHSISPWQGCAVYDAGLLRVRAFEMDDACLRLLSSYPAPPAISSIVRRETIFPFSTYTYFSSPSFDENSFCITLRRPSRDSFSNQLFFLEVRSCVA